MGRNCAALPRDGTHSVLENRTHIDHDFKELNKVLLENDSTGEVMTG